MAIVSLLSEISGNREFMGSLALLRNENNHAEFRNQIGEMLRNMPNIYSGNVVALGMLAILKNLIKGCCEPLVKGRMSLKEALKQVEILMSLEENVRELAHIVKGNGEFFKFADIVACDLRESRLILGDAMGNAVEIDLTSLVDERGMCKVYRFFGNTRMRNILLKVFKPGVEKECKDEFTYNNVHNFLSRKNLASFFPVLKIGADCSYVILEDITSLRKISDFDPRSMVYIVNNNFRNLVYLMSELNKDGYLMVQCLEADNIGVRNDGSLVFINGAIVDMKSSHDFNALEKLHTKLKTPHCAPEILNGEPINPAKVDTWSMGILIYELFRRVLIGERNIEDYRNLATEFSSGTESLISEVEGLDPIVVKIINRSSLVDPSYRADSAELLAIVRGEMVEEKIEKKKMEKEDESEMLSAVFGEIPGHNQQQGQNRNMAGPKW
jgi:hypothetical protein